MSNFFVDDKLYNERLDICRDCSMLFKPTMSCKRCGCFMKIKAKIGRMACPDKKWMHVKYTPEMSTDIPKELIQQAKDLMPRLKNGKAKDQATKKEMIELYNATHNAHYNPNTGCSSCLSTCYSGVKKIAENN